MRKILLIALFVTTAFIRPASAQITTKFGDNVGTLNGIMKAFYDVVTVKKGEKPSYQRDSCLHIPDPRCGMVRTKKDGSKVFDYMTLKEFHKRSDEFLTSEGFVETEIGRKVEQFGNIYHVWSTYESRNTADGPVIERGINSIEMYNDGKRFWIIGWFFDEESKINPIPKKYIGY
jgi:hypothetical protein